MIRFAYHRTAFTNYDQFMFIRIQFRYVHEDGGNRDDDDDFHYGCDEADGNYGNYDGIDYGNDDDDDDKDDNEA